MQPESTVFPIYSDKLFRNPDDLFKFSTKALETRELWFLGLQLPAKRLTGGVPVFDRESPVNRPTMTFLVIDFDRFLSKNIIGIPLKVSCKGPKRQNEVEITFPLSSSILSKVNKCHTYLDNHICVRDIFSVSGTGKFFDLILV